MDRFRLPILSADGATTEPVTSGVTRFRCVGGSEGSSSVGVVNPLIWVFGSDGTSTGSQRTLAPSSSGSLSRSLTLNGTRSVALTPTFVAPAILGVATLIPVDMSVGRAGATKFAGPVVVRRDPWAPAMTSPEASPDRRTIERSNPDVAFSGSIWAM